MDDLYKIRDNMGRQIEKLRKLNNILLNTPDSDQKLMDEWQDTIRSLHQTMKQVLVEAGKTYLLDQIRKCWGCTQQDKTESEYTAGIIFCNNTRCKDHYYYWSMCQALYGDIPEKILKQTKEEMEKERILYA